MELRHLRYFTTIAQTQSFSEAARLLHIAQPPLSAQIRALEDELGFKLFNRSSRGVTLTKEGQSFLPRAQETLAAAQRAKNSANVIAKGQSGQLRIGMISPAATDDLAQKVNSFHQQNPSVEIRVKQRNALTLLALLEADEIDVAFTRPVRAHPSLSLRVIDYHEQLLAIPKDHPWESRTSIPWKLLTEEKVLLVTPVTNAHYGQNFLRTCTHNNISPTVNYAADDLESLIWLVAAGMGVCPYPSSLTETAPKGVVFRSLAPRNFDLELAIAWRTADRTPLVQSFVQHFPPVEKPTKIRRLPKAFSTAPTP
jgi:DNA-binding transcriptional LysR family regulator